MTRPSVALAGNPNTGKSSIFNDLTGSTQHVGNWPGKTVERKEGTYRVDDVEYEVVDLPGTYSLYAVSPEEGITRDYLAAGTADVVVVVLDAANLERNLYLATQVLEMGHAVVVALNMIDVADRRGEQIDVELLAERLGVPVVPTVARDGTGIAELRRAIAGAFPMGASR
jgi:ferrous iron transport protein B